MPKSRRDKKITLTKTKRKGLPAKQKLVDELRTSVDTYKFLYTFSVENMRNNKLKALRESWQHSRFFLGKNKVMMVALGKDAASEYRKGLHKISRRLKGEVGLLFTNRTKDEVVQWFHEHKEADYARAGVPASWKVVLHAGPLENFDHSTEPLLRKLGLPTQLKKGVVTLLKDHQVCAEGDNLNPEQARLLVSVSFTLLKSL
uniref:mRNA turnover protein 4 homolog isoform X2 n=1 Tax=Myxine glutinosa TaxID=7769 RepID=UPI00358DE9AE